MTDNDKAEFARIWSASWSLYEKTVTDDVLSISFEALKTYSIEQVHHGLTLHIQSTKTGKFVPRPTDVIAHISINPSNQAESAWEQVDYAIRHIGAWESVYFDDELIGMIINKLGGWVQLCKSTEYVLEKQKSQFIEHYLRLRESPPITQVNRPLLGIAARQSKKHIQPITVTKTAHKKPELPVFGERYD